MDLATNSEGCGDVLIASDFFGTYQDKPTDWRPDWDDAFKRKDSSDNVLLMYRPYGILDYDRGRDDVVEDIF